MEKATNNGNKDEPIWFPANIDEALPIMIDPETATPVQRKIYFDEECKEWRAVIKVIPHKSYFSFQIKDHESDLVRTPLALIDIGRYYKDGKYGFPKDIFKAVEFFEKDGSADALYEISYLFRSETTLLDEKLYIEYLNQAITLGCEKANIEKSIEYIFNIESRNIETAIDILKKMMPDDGVKWFFLGYLAETTNQKQDDELAFTYYLNAAKENYKPALTRLGTENFDSDLESIKINFYRTLSDDNNIVNYCMGCVLFFGIGMNPYKHYGLTLLEKSASSNNPRAIEALYSIFEIDTEFINEVKSLKYLQMISNYNLSIAITLANRLLDGIGCEISDDNDRLAFSLLKEASDADDMIAMHNLAWMYKKGRGCNQDYAVALQLFQEAQRPNSYFHIGDMYEHGLGVNADMDTAIDYYKKGAEEESELAEQRLRELGIDSTNNKV